MIVGNKSEIGAKRERYDVKSQLQIALQRALGFHLYLVLHSILVVLTIRLRRNERDILEFVSRLPPDANVLDVGANVGSMALLFAWKCPRGKIFAFEPVPENYRAAKTVLGLFRASNTQLFQLGIGERDESATMIMPNSGRNTRKSGLSHVVDPVSEKVENGTFYTVRLVALDEFYELRNVAVSAIKIDVEDHERFVLRGGRELITRDRPLIFCELWGVQNKAECFDMLQKLDYEPYVATNAGLERYDPTLHRQVNFMFIPYERRSAMGIGGAGPG